MPTDSAEEIRDNLLRLVSSEGKTGCVLHVNVTVGERRASS